MNLKTVVICLKNRTFAVSQTTINFVICQQSSCDLLEKSYFCSIANNSTLGISSTAVGCDLLEKSYFCSIANNEIRHQFRRVLVVICLKNRTFAVSQTTDETRLLRGYLLWFAWKIVLLQYRKQLFERITSLSNGCDLLEKSYFCSIANNYFGITLGILTVVICLKNRTFAVSQTTERLPIEFMKLLWFAWKIVLLQYRKQRTHSNLEQFVVVICLKNRTFAVSQTTGAILLKSKEELWFAWKIVLLQYRKQLSGVFHSAKSRLWFAWKIVLLQYRKQRELIELGYCVRCDLLEKSYFCSIANNVIMNLYYNTIVVICLKNRTFAVSQTTALIFTLGS